jgi:four helix bundle protein
MAGSFKDLIAWKKGMELAREVYRATAKFPASELYGLSSQMRRAAVSIPSSIAEGQGRFSNQEFRHYLRNVKGSLCELETQAILAHDLGFLDTDAKSNLVALILTEQRIVSGLLASLDRKAT